MNNRQKSKVSCLHLPQALTLSVIYCLLVLCDNRKSKVKHIKEEQKKQTDLRFCVSNERIKIIITFP